MRLFDDKGDGHGYYSAMYDRADYKVEIDAGRHLVYVITHKKTGMLIESFVASDALDFGFINLGRESLGIHCRLVDLGAPLW